MPAGGYISVLRSLPHERVILIPKRERKESRMRSWKRSPPSWSLVFLFPVKNKRAPRGRNRRDMPADPIKKRQLGIAGHVFLLFPIDGEFFNFKFIIKIRIPSMERRHVIEILPNILSHYLGTDPITVSSF